MVSFILHYSKNIEQFALKHSLCFIYSTLHFPRPTFSYPLAITDLLTVCMVLSLPECHRSGITQYGAFVRLALFVYQYAFKKYPCFCRFDSSFPHEPVRPLKLMNFFSFGKRGKINKLWLPRKLYQDLNVSFHQIHYSYCNKRRKHVMFIKFLWDISLRSEMMLPASCFHFENRKGHSP